MGSVAKEGLHNIYQQAGNIGSKEKKRKVQATTEIGSLECISTDQPDKDQCSKHQRSEDQQLSTSTKIS
jgi:hypothetical protein